MHQEQNILHLSYNRHTIAQETIGAVLTQFSLYNQEHGADQILANINRSIFEVGQQLSAQTLGKMATRSMASSEDRVDNPDQVVSSINRKAIATIRQNLLHTPHTKPSEAVVPDGPSQIYQLVRVKDPHDNGIAHTALVTYGISGEGGKPMRQGAFTQAYESNNIYSKRMQTESAKMKIVCAWQQEGGERPTVQLNTNLSDQNALLIMRTAEQNLDSVDPTHAPRGGDTNTIMVVPRDEEEILQPAAAHVATTNLW